METNWILNLVDRVTGTTKKIVEGVKEAWNENKKYSESIDANVTKIQIALEKEGEHRKDIEKKIKQEKKALEELKALQDKMPGTSAGWKSAQQEIEKSEKKVEDFRKEIVQSKNEAKALKNQLKETTKETSNWVAAAVGFNQVSEIFGKLSDSFQFAADLAKSRDNIQRLTGATGDALDDITGKVHSVARAFDENDSKIAIAANSLRANMGVSYNEAIDLIEKGYDKGANLNGDMLQLLERYAPQLQQMGLTASESIALMVQAGKSGIPVDKAIDSLKQANDTLRERGPATQKALQGIGISVEELSKKTSFEAVQMISKSMAGASEAAKAKVLKAIFKESGKSAGSGFVEGIASVDMNIDHIPSVVEAGTGFKKLLADLESWFGNTFGNAGIYIQQFAGVAGSLNDVVGLISTLSKVTWIQNVAQKALNVTTGIFNVIASMGPWGWIAIAIGAVIAVVGLLADKFEWASGIVEGVKNSFMDFGKVLIDAVLLPFKMILSTAGALGKAIVLMFKGDFGGAWNAAKTAVDPIKDIIKDTKTAVNKFGEGYDKGVQEHREKKEKEEKEKEANSVLTNTGTPPPPPDLGLPPVNKKTKGGKDGMEISGAGGTKSITMNLEIKNYFNNVKGNVRDIANQVAGQINDRLRDALVAQ